MPAPEYECRPGRPPLPQTHDALPLCVAGKQVVQEAEKAKKMAERKDYYAILGVTQEANARDVKQVHTKSFLRAACALVVMRSGCSPGLPVAAAMRNSTSVTSALRLCVTSPPKAVLLSWRRHDGVDFICIHVLEPCACRRTG